MNIIFVSFPKGLLLMIIMVAFITACQPGKNSSYTNRLVNEKSLYLQQHAHNPVDWYPWGEEAFEKANKEGKLLLISIGYSSCHWCHVMEEETFSDTSVARYMNQNFVCIKVDREERPDVDDIYMTACQYASQRGCGWPLNAFATPDRRPIWAGTYFPREEWMRVLEHFSDMYRDDPQTVAQYANELTQAVSALNIATGGDGANPLDQEVLAELADHFLAASDRELGGREGAPKFPMPNSNAYLLAYHHARGNAAILEQIHTNLRGIAQGGIYDHLGGGFARYSVDIFWKVPHFEKMLYDNAQLIALYSQAYRYSKDEDYARVIRHSLDFIEREMTAPEGGFYASQDADSEGEEGTFYVWTEEEIRSVLTEPALANVFIEYYQITGQGNWENGKNVLFADGSIAAFAQRKGLEEAVLREDLASARAQLLAQRSKRPRPRLDDKILASWNALMLEAYIEAWWALGEESYLRAALKNADLIQEKMRAKDGSLFRTYARGEASIPAFLDDYAFVIQAFIRLYEATFDEKWLGEARELMQLADARFWDADRGIYYFAEDTHAGLVARRAEINDNVIPASNSAMARNCFQMERFFPGEGYEDRARALLDQVWPNLAESRDLTYFSNWSRLYLDFLFPPYEIAIVGPDAAVLRDSLLVGYHPNAIWMGSQSESELDLLKGKYSEGRTLIFVCQNRVCQLPVETTEAALRQIESN